MKWPYREYAFLVSDFIKSIKEQIANNEKQSQGYKLPEYKQPKMPNFKNPKLK